MYQRLLFLLILFSAIALTGCGENAEHKAAHQASGSSFDRAKWQVKEGEDYPFRSEMVNDILYNDTIRTLNQMEILELLGAPDRMQDGHLYYTVSQ